MTVIPNPFDGKLNNIKAVSSSGKKGNEIIFYGKLTVQKGAFRLMEYFKKLWDKGFEQAIVVTGWTGYSISSGRHDDGRYHHAKSIRNTWTRDCLY